MAEKVRTGLEVIEYILKVKKKKKVALTIIEKDCGFGRGSMSKWMESEPRISRVMKVLEYLKIDVTLKDRTELDEDVESSLIELEKDETDINLQIFSLMVQILNSKFTVNEKKRLCKVLKAFLD